MRASQYKCENIPYPTLVLYHSGVTRVKKKLARGLRKFCGDLRRFLRFCEELTRSVDISRSAPESSLALNNESHFKISIDRIDYALYNIVMKLRNRYEYYRDEWQRHWRVVLWHPLTAIWILIAIAYIFEL